ncbi:MAG: SUMF1/EgtB/PvdO family nonheme iron enzyme, partial [Acetobacteraceae bacterium]|nr:SUMF1/EgtB/PvdO family nonheme iron enzyme [Acetobacteraceae bacterium]
VLRGGSWNNNPQNLRAANRNRNTPDNRNNNSGFRLGSTLSAGAGAITVAPGAL